MTADISAPTPARDIPITPRAEGADLLAASLAALDRQLGELSDTDAGRPTDCTRWDVRAMIAHVVASTQECGRPWSTTVRAVRGRRRYPELALLDARNELQTVLFPGDLAQLRIRLRAVGGPAVRRVRRFPRALVGVPVPFGLPGVPPIRLGYLVAVLGARDTWTHAVDLAQATGRPRVAGPHDGPIIKQVIRDLDIRWTGPTVVLGLSGATGGLFLIGSGEPVATVQADAVELCRLLSGRPADDPVQLVDGDPAGAAALTAARVPF